MPFRLSLARVRAALSRIFGGKAAVPATLPPPVVAAGEAVVVAVVDAPQIAAAPIEAKAPPVVLECEITPRPENEPAEPAAIAAAPDPDVERLLARCARLEGQRLELTTRLADMQQQLRRYEQQQYLALGEIVGECLRLRQEYLSLKAARSGSAADREQARQADEDFDAYRRSTEHTAAPLPELDDDEQDELRRLYRAAAMRCHPDRAAETERAQAHEIFLRVQAAYQACDLEGLRGITAELAGLARHAQDTAAAMEGAAGSGVRRRVAELQTQVADLILAVQTLQLDPNYRQAVQVDCWASNFAEARAGFEAECEALRRQIASLEPVPA